jgi:hypothetical protein
MLCVQCTFIYLIYLSAHLCRPDVQHRPQDVQPGAQPLLLIPGAPDPPHHLPGAPGPLHPRLQPQPETAARVYSAPTGAQDSPPKRLSHSPYGHGVTHSESAGKQPVLKLQYYGF